MKPFKFFVMAVLACTSLTAFSQKAGKVDSTKHEVLSYKCPHHPNVSSDKEGKCPVCGMALALSKKEHMKNKATKNYTCPVHLDVASHKAGKCPKCSKPLELSKKENMKADVVKTYTCPMHPDEVSHTPGKCSKCAMDMTEKKDEHSGHNH